MATVIEIMELNTAVTDTGLMPMWVITEKPSDFPDKFVARLFVIGPGRVNATATYFLFDDLSRARNLFVAIPGMVRISRERGDDNVIVEAWI
jgi:hypothetical protein